MYKDYHNSPNDAEKRKSEGPWSTVIVLPTKKKGAKWLCKPKLVPFLKFHVSLKEKGNK